MKNAINAWLIAHKFKAGPKVQKKLHEIVATFTDVIEELKELKARNMAQKRVNDAKIRALEQHSAELNSEHDKAHNIHENLERLFKPASNQ